MVRTDRKLLTVVTFSLACIFFVWLLRKGQLDLGVNTISSRSKTILQHGWSSMLQSVDSEEMRQLYLGKAAGNQSNCYRALSKPPLSRMEMNKVTDDYSYCPVTYPFLDPHPYINNSKNPCWWDEGRLRCLPYFFLAGFSKCGTTDLFFRISLHPEVRNLLDKELHWFDYKRYAYNNWFINNYTSLLQRATDEIEKRLQEKGQSNIIMGEATPCYAWSSLNWPCYEGNENQMTEPLYTNADVIYRLNPKTKIIMLLREPVKRLRSRMLTYVFQSLHPAYKTPSAESFYNHVVEGIAKYKECFQRWSYRKCAYNGTLFGDVRLRLAEGMYSIYLRDWMKVFPRDQILILRFEDYTANTSEVLKKVYSFLGLAPLDSAKLTSILKRKPANEGRHYDLDVWTNKTTEILEDFYRPFTRDLAEFLEDERFAWHY